MKRKFFIFAFLLLAVAFQTPSLLRARAQVRVSDAGTQSRAVEDSTSRVSVVVELESAPVSLHERGRIRIPRIETDFEAPTARAYETRLQAEQDSFIARARLVSTGLRERARLRKLVNAVSVETGAGELASISALPGVRRVTLTRRYYATINASGPLINAPAVWETLGGVGAAGEGIKIAIIDTGIDITHPFFSDAGYNAPAGFPRSNNGSHHLTNNKVIVAKSFLDTGLTAQDGNGHGSNVAGIAAGNSGTISPLGAVSGVAPRAYLGNYRALDASGSGFDDLISLALEEAVSDGFDVINMSLGGDADDTLGILDQAVENAVAAGRIVVVSAGNSGEDGLFTVGSPGIAPSAITVAATTNAHLVGPLITVTGPAPVTSNLLNIGSVRGESGSSLVKFDESVGSLPYIYVSQGNRACNSLLPGSLTGKIALIERGNCNFTVKVNNAADAGAAAAIIFNRDVIENTPETAPGGETVFTMDVIGTRIPSTFVARTSGLSLRNFFQANAGANPTAGIAPLGSGGFLADVIAEFSSRGPSTLAQLKPDVAAPGVFIYSAAIEVENPAGVFDATGFAAVSGTSQAAPHVSGAAALLKQLHPSWGPSRIKSALMSSATTSVGADINSPGLAAAVVAQGSGRINIAAASEVNSIFTPPSLSVGVHKRKKNLTLAAGLAITNVSGEQNTLTFSAQQLDPSSPLVVSVEPASATIAAGETANVSLSIFLKKKKKALKFTDYTGYVNVNDSFGQSLHVPYWVRYN